ncbi:MAG: cob(I)yrinic acid a,c-diamide adenosyltransferase, partial [Clostridia bacterium]
LQFFKNSPSGELKSLALFYIIQLALAYMTTYKFLWDLNTEEKAAWIEAQQALFDEACEAACSKDVDLVILDEALGALHSGALDIASISYLMDHRNPGTELVLTGRAAPDKLLAKADYVTEMRAIKHPYEDGVHARKGIEY